MNNTPDAIGQESSVSSDYQDAVTYDELLADPRTRSLVAEIRLAALNLHVLRRSDSGSFIGRTEQESQAVADQIFTKHVLDEFRALTGSDEEIFGYIVALDPFTDCYQTFCRIGNWPEGKWENVWRETFMKGGRRRVSDGRLAIKFFEDSYISAMESGARRARILNWETGEVSPETRELGMKWSVTMPAFHCGRIIGFLNLSCSSEPAARRFVSILWWVMQTIISPFLVEAVLAVHDISLQHMVWRLFKLGSQRELHQRFSYDEHVGRMLLDRLYMFCPKHRDPELHEEPTVASTSVVKEIVKRFKRESGDSAASGWFDVSGVPDDAVVPMPPRPLEGVIWELLMNAYVAVVRHRRGMASEEASGARSQPIQLRADTTTVSDRTIVIQLMIEDRGIGMDRYTLRRAFDPGFSATPSEYEANGFGLVIVRMNVEKYDGIVRLHSDGVGRGCLVSLSFRPEGVSDINGQGHSCHK